jgi:hypothetical protein
MKQSVTDSISKYSQIYEIYVVQNRFKIHYNCICVSYSYENKIVSFSHDGRENPF